MKMVPDFFHPIAGPFIVRPAWKHFGICLKIAAPVIEDRLHRMRTEGENYKPEVSGEMTGWWL
jgi:hypothetical protein